MSSVTSGVVSHTTSAMHSSTNLVCTPSPTKPSLKPLGDGMNLQDNFILVGGVCTIVTCVAILAVLATHLVWRTNFAEQRQLMRIAFLPAFFAVCSWFSVRFYGMGNYLDSIPKVYEAYAITCFFFFMIQTITNTEDEKLREQFFVGVERKKDRKPFNRIHDRGSLRWYKIRSFAVYQSLIVTTLCQVGVVVIKGAFCPTNKPEEVGSFAFTIISTASVLFALMTKLAFYRRFRKEYNEAKILQRFFAFKGMVFLIIHQQLIMEIINFARAVKPTSYMTMADFTLGIPEFMIQCECAVFSIGFLFTLSGFQYRPSSRRGYGDIEASQRMGHEDVSVAKYFLSIFWPSDIIKNLSYCTKTLFGLMRGRNAFDYTGETGVTWTQRQYKDAQATSGYESYCSGPMGVDAETEYDRVRSAQAYQKVHLTPYPGSYRDQSPSNTSRSSHEEHDSVGRDRIPLVDNGAYPSR